MKKVLVLAAALALFATPALAVIENTGHDLGDNGLGTTRMCIFCHAPHYGASDAPLWNRDPVADTVIVGTPYTSGTMDATVVDYTAGSILLCFSCHDGAATPGELINNSWAGVTGTLTLGSGNLNEAGIGLSNDHPVGITYQDSIDNGDTELQPAASVTTLIPNGIVECASCHDVHDNSFPPFLTQTNADSALCTACHIK